MKRLGLIALVVLCLAGSSVFAQAYRAGGGLQYAISGGDLDSGVGIVGYGDYVVTDIISFRGTLGYLQADFDAGEGMTGDYSRFSTELALHLRTEYEGILPYAGAGAGYYFNTLDGDQGDIHIDDSFGMFFEGGVRVPLTETLDVDTTAKYLLLKPEGPEFVEFDLSSFMLTIGLTYNF